MSSANLPEDTGPAQSLLSQRHVYAARGDPDIRDAIAATAHNLVQVEGLSLFDDVRLVVREISIGLWAQGSLSNEILLPSGRCLLYTSDAADE